MKMLSYCIPRQIARKQLYRIVLKNITKVWVSDGCFSDTHVVGKVIHSMCIYILSVSLYGLILQTGY